MKFLFSRDKTNRITKMEKRKEVSISIILPDATQIDKELTAKSILAVKPPMENLFNFDKIIKGNRHIKELNSIKK